MKMKLRKDQKKCIKACMSHSKGIVIGPTGYGKSIVAQELTRKIIKQKPGSFLGVIYVPRIILAKQWVKSTANYLIKQHNLNVNFICVNSEGMSQVIKNEIEEVLYECSGPGVVPILTTTQVEPLQKRVNRLVKDGQHVIILSTYHSNRVLRNLKILFDLTVFDEAQFLPSNPEFLKSTETASNKQIFLTATPRYTDSDEGTGMNNEEIYGPVIYEAKPVEMIKIGAIVAPDIHIVGVSERVNEAMKHKQAEIKSQEYNLLADMIFDTHAKHKEKIDKESSDPEKLGAKMLVVCNGQLPLQGMFNSRRFRELRRENPNIKIFGLCTDYGVEFDGQHYSPPVNNTKKEEFLLSLYNMKDADDALVFHVDMIAEGLDVPGLTAVMPLRNLGKIKFLQNLGRSTRPHQEDAQRIRDGELDPMDTGSRIKPGCSVILPRCMDLRDDFLERNVNIITALRSDYKFDPSERVVVDILNPGQADINFEEDNLKRQIRGVSTDDIVHFYHQLEEKGMKVEEIIHRARLQELLANGEWGVIDEIADQANLLDNPA